MSVPIIFGLFIPIIVAFFRNYKKNFICILRNALNITIVNCFINHFWTVFLFQSFQCNRAIIRKICHQQRNHAVNHSLQPQQLLFLCVKFFLRDSTHVKQFFELF